MRWEHWQVTEVELALTNVHLRITGLRRRQQIRDGRQGRRYSA